MSVASPVTASPLEVHDFLIQVGLLLHRHGTPSHRLERVLTELAGSLGVDGAFLYTPTSLLISLRDSGGEVTYLGRINSGDFDVDKLIRFDETLEQFQDGQLDIRSTSERLTEIANSAPPFPAWLTILACALAGTTVAMLFRGTAVEIGAAAGLGLLVACFEVFHRRLQWEQGFLEPLAGFAAAIGSLAFAHWVHPVDDRLVALAALIVMIPGLRITVALTELAVGHLSAGVARLAGGMVSLLTIFVGVSLGWRFAGHWRNFPALPAQPGVLTGEGWQWTAIAIAPIAFAIVFRARWRQWPLITAVSVAGFAASVFAGKVWGLEGGAFLGALTVAGSSNLYARIRDRPALVPLTPGIILLVPGTLGYRSLTAFLDRETIAGIDFAFNMLIVAVSLVGGILAANVFVPPKRIL